MSKKAKAAAKDKRASMKRSRKAQQKALYESYKAKGTNSKKKRSTTGGNGVRTRRHVITNCGNVGCSRATCFPHLAKQKMNDSNDPRVRFRTHAQQKADGLF